MINRKIIDSICLKLSEVYPEINIYTESVEQGIKTPCFFVFQLSEKLDLFLNKRYKNDNLFTIQYLKDSDEDEYITSERLEKLFDILEYIEVDNTLIRGTNMQIESNDDLYTFTINYDLFLQKQIEKDNYMETYKVVTDEKRERN